MISNYYWIIPIICIADIIVTYIYMRRLKNVKKEKDWYEHEASPMLKFFFGKFGLNTGMFFGGVVSLVVISFIAFKLARFNDILFGYIIGVYSFAFYYHCILNIKFNKLRK